MTWNFATSAVGGVAVFALAGWHAFEKALTYLSETSGGLPVVVTSAGDLPTAQVLCALAWGLAGLGVSVATCIARPVSRYEVLVTGGGLAALALGAGIGWFFAVTVRLAATLAGSGADAIPLDALALYASGLCAAATVLLAGAAVRCIRHTTCQAVPE